LNKPSSPQNQTEPSAQQISVKRKTPSRTPIKLNESPEDTVDNAPLDVIVRDLGF